MNNPAATKLIHAVLAALAISAVGYGSNAFAGTKAGDLKLAPGPRGPVGPDVPLTRAEKTLFARQRVTVKGFTSKAVQLACDQAARKDTPSVVFLPAGKYVFEKEVNVPAGITILGEGSKTLCFTSRDKGAIFSVKQDNVRITRLRLLGTSKRDTKDYSTGIAVSGENIRVDHCEISYLCRGINFSGGSGQVDHNHIHHCIRDGLGYGVSMYSGARVLISDNDFGPCRHCIASNGALDWSSPKRVGKYIHKPNVRKTHWELIHNRFYGDETTDYHRHWVIDTHPGMDGTFVVENNLVENLRTGLGIRDGAGIIKGNLFRNIARTAIIISWGKHNGIIVEGTMPRDIDISDNRFEKVKKKYDIRKSENITIDGKIVPETETKRSSPKTKIPRLKPMAEHLSPQRRKTKG